MLIIVNIKYNNDDDRNIMWEMTKKMLDVILRMLWKLIWKNEEEDLQNLFRNKFYIILPKYSAGSLR